MKQEQLIALLALLLALGLPLPACLFASGETDEAVFDAVVVKNEHELITALENPDVSCITLGEHIILTSELVINRSRPITIDLGGQNIVSCDSGVKNRSRHSVNRQVSCAIDLQAGHLELIGHGHVMSLNQNGAAIRIRGALTPENINYSHLTIGAQVILNAPNFHGIHVAAIGGAAYGITINIAGAIIAENGIYLSHNIQGPDPQTFESDSDSTVSISAAPDSTNHDSDDSSFNLATTNRSSSSNLPVINIADGARIIADERRGIALYSAGYGIWNVGAAQIAGGTGLAIRTGLANFVGTSLTATGAFADPLGWSDRIHGIGAIIQIERSAETSGDLHIIIAGGRYYSEQSYVFAEYGVAEINRSLEINSGQFIGAQGIFYNISPEPTAASQAIVTGGEFNADVTNYLIPDHIIKKPTRAKLYSVIDVSKTRAEEKLESAKHQLKLRLDLAAHYLSEDYSAGDLGKWRDRLSSLLTILKRANTTASKALRREKQAEKLLSVERALSKAISNVQDLEDEIRAEIISLTTAVEAIDPADYTDYSYNQLVLAAQSAQQLLSQETTELESLYSVSLDLEINLDLLEENDLGVTELDSESPAPSDISTVSSPEPATSVKRRSSKTSRSPKTTKTRKASKTSKTSKTTETSKLPDASAILAEPNNLVIPQARQLASKALSDTSVSDSQSLDSVILPPPPAPFRPQASASLIGSLALSTTNSPSTADSSLASSILQNNSLSQPTPDESTILNNPPEVRDGSLPQGAPDETLTLALHNLRLMLEAVKDLRVTDYQPDFAEQFGELQVAIAHCEALLSQTLPPRLEKIIACLDMFQKSTVGLRGVPEPVLEPTLEPAPKPTLTPKPTSDLVPEPVLATVAPSEPTAPQLNSTLPDTSIPPNYNLLSTSTLSEIPEVSAFTDSESLVLDWSALSDIVRDIADLNSDDYTASSYAQVLTLLGRAKTLISNNSSSQSEIEELVFELNLAVLALEPSSSNIPRVSATNFSEPSDSSRNTLSFSDSASTYGYSSQNTLSPLMTPSARPAAISAANYPDSIEDPSVEPSLLMSMMAGAYAGLAAYRRSRVSAKRRRHAKHS